jgi:hypothetical protein
MFDYEQRPNTEEYRDNFDDIFRKSEKDKPVKVEGEDEDIGT